MTIRSNTFTFDNSECKMNNINDNHKDKYKFNVENINIVEQSNDLGILISHATAKWTTDQTDNSLENINLTARPGRLVVVIGPVGAGKVSTIFKIFFTYRSFSKYFLILFYYNCFYFNRVHYYKQFYESYHFVKGRFP